MSRVFFSKSIGHGFRVGTSVPINRRKTAAEIAEYQALVESNKRMMAGFKPVVYIVWGFIAFVIVATLISH
jgi:hypothetical protein